MELDKITFSRQSACPLLYKNDHKICFIKGPDKLRAKNLGVYECLAVFLGPGRAFTAQSQGKGQDRTRPGQSQDRQRKVSRLERVQGTG